MTQLQFDIKFYKRQDTIYNQTHRVGLAENRSLVEPLKEVIHHCKKTMEWLVVNKYSVTTYQGIFALIYVDNQKNPVAMVEYRPAFNFKEFYATRDINDMVSAICPGGLNG